MQRIFYFGRHLYNKETVDNDKLSVDYESEENSFDRLESTSPSMEPAPWKGWLLLLKLFGICAGVSIMLDCHMTNDCVFHFYLASAQILNF